MSDLLELQLQVLWSCLMLALDSGPLQNRYVLEATEPSSLQLKLWVFILTKYKP